MIFKAENKFEPKAFKCVVKMNFTKFNSFKKKKNSLLKYSPILKKE
jgi:hypothetical protein